jgi:hypothetical protein
MICFRHLWSFRKLQKILENLLPGIYQGSFSHPTCYCYRGLIYWWSIILLSVCSQTMHFVCFYSLDGSYRVKRLPAAYNLKSMLLLLIWNKGDVMASFHLLKDVQWWTGFGGTPWSTITLNRPCTHDLLETQHPHIPVSKDSCSS